jgi:hypothetical protein
VCDFNAWVGGWVSGCLSIFLITGVFTHQRGVGLFLQDVGEVHVPHEL